MVATNSAPDVVYRFKRAYSFLLLTTVLACHTPDTATPDLDADKADVAMEVNVTDPRQLADRSMADSVYRAGISAIDAEDNDVGMALLKQAADLCTRIDDGYPEVQVNCYARVSSRARNLYLADTMSKYGNLAFTLLREQGALLSDSMIVTICGHLIPMCRGMHRLDEARELVIRMADAAEGSKEPTHRLFAMKNASAVYKDLGDFDLAIKYAKEYVRLHEEQGDLKPLGLLQVHQLIGECYLNLRSADSSMAHYRKALRLMALGGDAINTDSRMFLYIHLMHYYSGHAATEPDSMLHYMKLADQCLGSEDTPRTQAIRNGQLRPKELAAYGMMGRTAYADSLARADLAGILNLSDTSKHISWADISEPTTVLDQLDNYASVFTTIYYFQKSPETAATLLRIYDEYERGTDLLMNESDPRLLLKDALVHQRLNDYRLMVHYDLGEKRTAGPADLAGIFERRKMLQSRAAVRAQMDRERAAGLPDALDELYGLRAQLERAEPGLGASIVDSLRIIDVRIDNIRRRLLGLRAKGEAQQGTVRWEALFKELPDSTMIVQYAWTDSILLLLAVSNQGYSFEHRRIFPWLNEQLDLEFEALRSNEQDKYDVVRSSELGDSILPVTMALDQIRNLIVIPDGRLNALPFEALRFKGKEAEGFLLDKFDIRYEYCLTFLSEPLSNLGHASVLACAPVFNGSEAERIPDTTSHQFSIPQVDRAGNYTPLSENVAEVSDIGSMVVSNLLIGQDLDEGAVRSRIEQVDILHFATHAFCSDSVPELSGVVLADKEDREGEEGASSRTDGILHAYEIQSLSLNAELIALSACETAVGQNRSGEGAMSLARAFKYAGAKSVVSSLWKVDDRATKEIMVKFYEHLAEGMGKADALAAAKRWYRKENPNAPPSHWAAFILIGDNEPVRLKKRSRIRPWMIILGTLLVFGGGYALMRRRSARSAA